MRLSLRDDKMYNWGLNYFFYQKKTQLYMSYQNKIDANID